MVATSWIRSADTSTSIRSGISDGRQETSTVRMRSARTPLWSLTPAASPTTWIGTSTVISSSIRTAWKSMWMSESRTGSNWRSRTTAGRASVSPRQAQAHEDAARRVRAEGALHLGRGHGQREGGVAGAVEDGGDEARPAQAPDGPLADGLAGLGGQLADVHG